MIAWLCRNRTKIVGYAGVLFGVLELNIEQIKIWIPEHYRGMVPIVFGGITALIGHWNSLHGRNEGDPP